MDNISGGLSKCREDIRKRMIDQFRKVHDSYADGIQARMYFAESPKPEQQKETNWRKKIHLTPIIK